MKLKLTTLQLKNLYFHSSNFPLQTLYLGPEMKSTGESMGIDENFGVSYYKAQLSAGMELPKKGRLFISVRDSDKNSIRDIVENAENLGFELVATEGTANAVKKYVNINTIRKVSQESPNIRDAVLNGEIDLIINTPSGKQSADDGYLY